MKIDSFTFGPFQENTYVLSDQTGDCVIVDPGCYERDEKKMLKDFILDQKLNPVKIILTHGHIDHILGAAFISKEFSLPMYMHKADLPGMMFAPEYGKQWGIHCDIPPEPTGFLEEGDTITFGNTVLEIIFTPGHSPGSICFIHKKLKFVMGGDVLFHESIGRTDLPGGSFELLSDSIRQKLFSLDDEYQVFSGHGIPTSIGHEKVHNPFVRA